MIMEEKLLKYIDQNCQNETLKKIHWIKLVKNSKLDVINVHFY